MSKAKLNYHLIAILLSKMCPNTQDQSFTENLLLLFVHLCKDCEQSSCEHGAKAQNLFCGTLELSYTPWLECLEQSQLSKSVFQCDTAQPNMEWQRKGRMYYRALQDAHRAGMCLMLHNYFLLWAVSSAIFRLFFMSWFKMKTAESLNVSVCVS